MQQPNTLCMQLCDGVLYVYTDMVDGCAQKKNCVKCVLFLYCDCLSSFLYELGLSMNRVLSLYKRFFIWHKMIKTIITS